MAWYEKMWRYSVELFRSLEIPVLLHVCTRKGKGYSPAEENPGKFHGVGRFDPDTGETTNGQDATITNGSSGSIVVTQVKVTNYGTWRLAAFDADLRNASVDSNQIGVAVRPVGGRQALAAPPAALPPT